MTFLALPSVRLAVYGASRRGRTRLFLSASCCTSSTVGSVKTSQQESRAVARKPRDAAAVLFGLKFADDIHCKFKSSHASFEARLQSSKHTGTKQNLTQNGDSRSFKVTFWSQWKGDKALSNTV